MISREHGGKKKKRLAACRAGLLLRCFFFAIPALITLSRLHHPHSMHGSTLKKRNKKLTCLVGLLKEGREGGEKAEGGKRRRREGSESVRASWSFVPEEKKSSHSPLFPPVSASLEVSFFCAFHALARVGCMCSVSRKPGERKQRLCEERQRGWKSEGH